MLLNNFTEVAVHTSNRERLFIKDLFLADYEREGLRLLHEKLHRDWQIEVADGVFFRITWFSYQNKDDAYRGTFFTYSDDEVVPFLFTFGAGTPYAARCVWRQDIKSCCERYHLPMALRNTLGVPYIANLFMPCDNPDAMAYLYSGRCRDFCRRVGFALLVPEATQAPDAGPAA